MKAPAFLYRRPRDIEAALSLLAEHAAARRSWPAAKA